MRLYHGTSARHLDAILSQGILPRGVLSRGNWTATVESNPGCVYLTTAYAGFFAANACRDDEQWLVLEIDRERLDDSRLLPDEDFLEQATRGRARDDAEVIGGVDMLTRTRWYRVHARAFSHHLDDSLSGLGTCAHEGAIPVEAITRYSLYDPESNPSMTLMWIDPSICLLNYQIIGHKYRAMTRWLMGEPVAPKEIDPWAATDEEALVRVLNERRGLLIEGKETVR